MSLSSEHSIRPSSTDLAEHLSLLRRRKALFLSCLAVGLAVGLGLMWLNPVAYTATTQVLVMSTGVQEQPNQVTNRQREALNLDTEAQIAQSAVVAAKATALLDAVKPEPVTVSVPANSSVLWISVTAGSAATAAAQSAAYAQAYLADRTATAQASVDAQLKVLITKLKQVRAALGKVVAEVLTLTKGTAAHTLATERESVLSRQVFSLTVKYDSLKTVAVTPGSVISKAVPPTVPSSPSLPLYLGSGLMAGLVIGAAAAYTRDRLDTRLRSGADVERLSGLPVLADLSGPLRRHELHDLASSVLAACPGERLLVRTVPTGLGSAQVCEPLSASVRLAVLSGSEIGDMARADAALLLIWLNKASSVEVAAAVRHLHRHGVPIIGAVTTANPLPPAPELEQAPSEPVFLREGRKPGLHRPNNVLMADTFPPLPPAKLTKPPGQAQ